LLEYIGNCEELNIAAIDILLRRWFVITGACDLAFIDITD